MAHSLVQFYRNWPYHGLSERKKKEGKVIIKEEEEERRSEIMRRRVGDECQREAGTRRTKQNGK